MKKFRILLVLQCVYCTLLSSQTIENICPGECLSIGEPEANAYCINWSSPTGYAISDPESATINVCPSLDDIFERVIIDEDGDIVESVEYRFNLHSFTLTQASMLSPSGVQGDPDWVMIRNDPTPNPDPTIVFNPRPVISGESSTSVLLGSQPIGYVSGSTARSSVTISTECTQSFYVKAEGIDGFDLPPVLVSPSNGIAEYPPTQFVQAFAENTVLYYPEFELTWLMSFDSDPNNPSAYAPIGEVKFSLYVLYDSPITSVNDGPYEHSLIDIACRGSHEQTVPLGVVSTIYDDFQDRMVSKVNSTTPMRYWGGQTPYILTNPAPGQGGLCFTYEALLAYNDATCGTWAELLDRCVALHGITTGSDEGLTAVHVLPPNPNAIFLTPLLGAGVAIAGSTNPLFPPDQSFYQTFLDRRQILLNGLSMSTVSPYVDNITFTDQGTLNGTYQYSRLIFLVKNWSSEFGAGFILSEIQEGPNQNIILTPDAFQPCQTINLANGQTIPYSGQTGLGGQGNINPLAEFSDHAIYRYQNRVFDPSYGTLATNQTSWESNSLYAYGAYAQAVISGDETTNGVPVTKEIIFFSAGENNAAQTTFTSY